MAELTLWGFRSGTSVLHRLDPRFSLLITALVSLTTLQMNAAAVLSLLIVCIGLAGYMGIGIRRLVADLRWVTVLLALIVVARMLTMPGHLLLDTRFLTVSREGLLTGSLIAGRLLIIVLVGVMFMRSTAPSGIRAAVQWYLSPVPLVPHARVGMMISLLLRFIPLIFRQSDEIGDAQRARGVENVKNPIRRMSMSILPLMRKLFLTADEMALAMSARGYREDRTPVKLTATAQDWIILAAVGCTCAATLVWL